jgi:hypothetical protein
MMSMDDVNGCVAGRMSVAEALDAARTNLDQWHAEHQGDLRDIIARVWWCGDDWCDCTQAQITARFCNIVVPNAVVLHTLWRGEFHTDGEQGAVAELDAKRAEMEAVEPQLARRITWP